MLAGHNTSKWRKVYQFPGERGSDSQNEQVVAFLSYLEREVMDTGRFDQLFAVGTLRNLRVGNYSVPVSPTTCVAPEEVTVNLQGYLQFLARNRLLVLKECIDNRHTYYDDIDNEYYDPLWHEPSTLDINPPPGHLSKSEWENRLLTPVSDTISAKASILGTLPQDGEQFHGPLVPIEQLVNSQKNT